MSVVGFVAKLNTKEGVGKKGPWTLYSAQINDQWYSAGFNKPSFKEGDYISFESIERKDKNGKTQYDIDPKTVKQEKAPAAAAGTASGGSTQQFIHYQSATKAAIDLVAVLLQHELIPLPVKTKKNEGAIYQLVLDAVNKLTVQFYHDTQTLRLLETVVDAGALEEPEEAAAGEDEGDEP